MFSHPLLRGRRGVLHSLRPWLCWSTHRSHTASGSSAGVVYLQRQLGLTPRSRTGLTVPQESQHGGEELAL
jgi:hypothetical protein